MATGADAELVAEILRDSTRDASAWGPRDPVVGAGLRRLTQRVPDDAEVRAAMATGSPRLAPLPDRTGQTLDSLLEARVVVAEGDGCCTLFDAPESDHVIDAAIADVRRYDALRADAVDAARSRRDAETLGERARPGQVRAVQDRAVLGVIARWMAFELALGLLVAAGAAAGVAWLRARPIVVALDAHGLSVGPHRVAWDEADDVAWREDRVVWTTARGEVRVRGLSLAADEVKALQRVTTSLRTARFGIGEDAGRAALGALVDRARG